MNSQEMKIYEQLYNSVFKYSNYYIKQELIREEVINYCLNYCYMKLDYICNNVTYLKTYIQKMVIYQYYYLNKFYQKIELDEDIEKIENDTNINIDNIDFEVEEKVINYVMYSTKFVESDKILFKEYIINNMKFEEIAVKYGVSRGYLQYTFESIMVKVRRFLNVDNFKKYKRIRIKNKNKVSEYNKNYYETKIKPNRLKNK